MIHLLYIPTGHMLIVQPVHALEKGNITGRK